jgi:integrase
MARRQDAQNLMRRGNIWYWRPRLPVSLFKSGLNRKLSLSLRQTDFNRAKFMARRLNTMLAELKMRPGSGMTRQEGLRELFKAEIDRMNELMEDLFVAAKATGNHLNPGHLEADVINGWAYRLLEKFGTAIELSFDADCDGYKFLRMHGVPVDFIPMIAETYEQERLCARSQYFEKPLKEEMQEIGLKTDRLNLERARTEIFRAKADVLLNTGPRYQLIQDPLEISAEPEAGRVSPTPKIVENGASADSARTNTETAPDEPDRYSDLQDEAAADGYPALLPVSDFLELFEIYKRNKAREWKAGTAKDVRVAVRMFQDVLVFNNVEHTGGIRQAHIAAFRDLLSLLPKNYGQSSRLRTLPFTVLKGIGEKMLEEADDDETAKVGLEAQTIRKHMGAVDGFRDFLAARGHQIVRFEMKGLRPAKKRAFEIASLTPKPGPDKTEAMFHMPIFAGCQSDKRMDEPGPVTIHSSLYYMPMLLVYLGMRRAEVAGLMVDEVLETTDGPAIEIKANEIRSLKNKQSDRMLPIPSEILRLGFLDYVDVIRSLGYEALFPELVNPFKKDADPGDRFYKNFNPLFVQNAAKGGPSWIRVIHAMRHGHADTLKQNGVSPALIEDIQGRDGMSETAVRYTNPAGLRLLKDNLTRYPIVTDHLKPSPIRLLGFVKTKKPAPWFREINKISPT